MRTRFAVTSLCAALCVLPAVGQTPLGSEFTWQAHVSLDGQPLNGTADFQFKLFDALQGGAQVGTTQAVNNVTVTDGLVNAELDFGAAAFNGDERFLEIAVRSPAGGGQFQTLAPRQPLTGAPYALKVPGVDGHSLNAADGSPLDALFVNSDGNVGIGTTSPAAKLDVRGGAMLVENVGDQADILWLANERSWVFRQEGIGAAAALKLQSIGGGGNKNFIVQTDGFIGLGSAVSPRAPVHAAYQDPFLVLQDMGPTNTQVGYIGLWNSAGAETGWFGYGTPGSPDLGIQNKRAGGDIYLLPGAGGTVNVPVLEITGADLAERFPTSEPHENVEPGTVMAIDPANPGKLCIARGAYNRCVAGIVSGANNLSVGAVLGNLPGHENAPPIALSGRVYVRCTAAIAAIQPGDLLTTSDLAGHAMKAVDHERSQGAIIGKAMTSLAKDETGMVLVLVTLQ